MLDYNEIYEEEQNVCPQCGEDLTTVRPIMSSGDGFASAEIMCTNNDCDFEAVEEWKHDRTVRSVTEEVQK